MQAAVAAMADAVRKGDMRRAAELGNGAFPELPLALAPADVGIVGASGTSSPFPGGASHTAAAPRAIARGAQGAVYASTWGGREVAVKVPRLGTSADLDRFRKEACLMAALGGGQGSHIMPLLAARCVPPSYFLVMPLAGPSLAARLYATAPAWRPTWREAASVGVQLAAALAALHDAGYVHRDIKPDNVLMALSTDDAHDPHSVNNDTVLLSDLGLAVHEEELAKPAVATPGGTAGRRRGPTGGFHKADAVGTQEYCGPELLLHSAPASPASDVFALAITLNELTTAVPPYSDCTRDGPPGLHTILDRGYTRQQLAAAVAGEGLRPPFPAAGTRGAGPPAWSALLAEAWATDPAARPTAAQLRDRLLRLLGEGDDGNAAAVDEDSDTVMVDAMTPRPAQAPGGKDAVAAAGLVQYITQEQAAKAAAVAERSLAAKARDTDAWVAALQAAGARVIDFAAPLPVSNGDSSNTSSPVCSAEVVAYTPTLSAGIVESVGGRDHWEDRSVMLPAGALPRGAALLAVFDGHRGAAAADFCVRRVPELAATLLAALPPDVVAPPPTVMRDLLVTLDQEYAALWTEEMRTAAAQGRRPTYPGCTAVVALLVGSSLTVGNLGDGRAVVGLGGADSGATMPLTRPHTAEDPEERARLETAGTPATWHGGGGGWRLGGGSGLQVSRSVGDFDAKGDTTSGAGSRCGGLTAVPEVVQLTLGPQHLWLVLGSDGLWDVLPDTAVARFMADTVKHPAMAARRLVAEALDAGSKDNITAMVAFLRPVTTLEQVFTSSRAAHSAPASGV